MSETKRAERRGREQKRRCEECALYKRLMFQDGRDAMCGRCSKPGKGRVRQVRAASRAACEDFVEREAGGGDDTRSEE